MDDGPKPRSGRKTSHPPGPPTTRLQPWSWHLPNCQMVDATHLPNCHLPNLAKRRYSRLRLKIHQIHTFPKCDKFHRAKHQICAFCFLRNAAFCFFCFAEPLVRRNEIQTELSLSNARKVFLRKVIFFRNRGPPPSNLAVPQKKTLSKGSAKKPRRFVGFLLRNPYFAKFTANLFFFLRNALVGFFLRSTL